MKKLIILTVVAIVMVGFVVFLFMRDKEEVSVPSPTPTPTPTQIIKESPLPLPTDVPGSAGLIKEVLYNDNGFSPSTITVSVGESVRFFNESGRLLMWPASAVHPTHKVYPGSDIAKCGTQSQYSIFDTCKGYGPVNWGDPSTWWDFKFNEKGTWKYHNHLQPNHSGTIIVE